MDRLSKICLLSIAASLAVIAFRPLLSPARVDAAAGRYKMQFIYAHESEGEKGCKFDELSMSPVNMDAAQGWEAVSISQQPSTKDGCAVYSVLEKRQ